MRRLINILFIVLLTSCVSVDNSPDTEKKVANENISPDTATNRDAQKKPFVIVILAPFDVNAGRGISPNTRQLLTKLIKRDSTFSVHSFRPDDTISSPYNVFDEKYCKEIVKVINPDAIIMTKHELQKETGDMYSSEWSIIIKAYLPKQDTSIILYNYDFVPHAKVDKEIFGRPILSPLKKELIKNYR